MKRHLLRQRTMKYLYQHCLLNKPIFQILVEEGHLMKPDGDLYVIRHLENIEAHEDHYIEQINQHLSEWEFTRLSYVEQAILLLGWSELSLKEDERAIVIDEAIKLAKTYADESSYQFINAVLDHYV